MKISMTYTMQQKQTNEKPDSLLIIEKWKKVSSRSANDEVDCGDKKCYLEFQILQDCNLILETNTCVLLLSSVLSSGVFPSRNCVLFQITNSRKVPPPARFI